MYSTPDKKQHKTHILQGCQGVRIRPERNVQCTNIGTGRKQTGCTGRKMREKVYAVINSWRSNWNELTTYFKYDTKIRKLIYTTNPIENLNRQLRKYTKTSIVFLSLLEICLE